MSIEVLYKPARSKAAEEAVKAAACALGLSEVLHGIRARGRRTVTDLKRAARAAARALGEDFYVGWDRANYMFGLPRGEAGPRRGER